MENIEVQKNITLDDLAVMVANGFADINERMATKDDLAELRTELKTDISDLRKELKTEIAELRTELKTEIAEFREEFVSFKGEMRSEVRDIKDDIRDIQRQLVEIRKDIDNLYKLSSGYKKEIEEENKMLRMVVGEIVKQTNVKLPPELMKVIEK